MNTITSVTLPRHTYAPRYDRRQLQSRIVHFDFGAFHRARQILLTDRMLSAQGGDWGIRGVSLFSGDQLMNQLHAQNHLYTVLKKGMDGNQAIIVGAVHECLNVKPSSLAAIIGKLYEPQTAIASLIVTEKGYCIGPVIGALDTSNPRIIHDLQNPEEPHPTPGTPAEALKRRREHGLTPSTVLPCDNIPDSDHVVRDAALGMAEKRSPELVGWIEEYVNFPGTVVDHIVPAAADESLTEINQHLGVSDPCAVSCEPLIQWVAGGNFAAGRPAWEVASVQMVNGVLSWGETKLRMLSGSHSFLAYPGYLSGFTHISDCTQNRTFRRAVRILILDEQAPALRIKDADLTQYADKLITRSVNPTLEHKIWQIAMDGSQRLP